MRVLTRYLLRAHAGPFIFALSALTGVLVINIVARYLADLAGKGLPADVLAQFFLFLLPAQISMTVPMAVLVAVLYTFSQMAAENEIMAIEAGGIDMRRLLAPLLLAAVVLAGIMTWFNDRVLAEGNYRASQLMLDIGRKSPVFTLQEQSMNPIRTGGQPSYYLRAARINPTTNELRDVVIFDVSDARVGRTIYADSGTMAFNAARTDLLLTLYDGHLREVNFDDPASFQNVGFAQQVIQMPGIGDELERGINPGYRDDRSMSIAAMQAHIDTLRSGLAALHPRSHTELRASLQREVLRYQVEIHKKLAIAAAIVVFVLIGAPLALRFPHGGVGTVITASLAIFAVYWVGLMGGETLADAGYLRPAWAMWGTNVVFGLIGIGAFLRMGRNVAHARR